MSRTVLRKYAPLYISVIATAIVMVLLFLRPDSALGLSVTIDTPQNSRNSLQGFKLDEPVVIKANIKLQGNFEDIQTATLALEQITGDAGYLPVTGGTVISLPYRGRNQQGPYELTPH